MHVGVKPVKRNPKMIRVLNKRITVEIDADLAELSKFLDLEVDEENCVSMMHGMMYEHAKCGIIPTEVFDFEIGEVRRELKNFFVSYFTDAELRNTCPETHKWLGDCEAKRQ